MGITKQALKALVVAEQRLRELVADAATIGDYDTIQCITNWARHLQSIIEDAQHHQSKVPAGSNMTANPAGGDLIKSERERLGAEQAITTPAIRSQTARRVGYEYPKFFRQGNQLLKIGWSKTTRSEYEHKAARSVVDALASAIVHRSRNKRLFTAEELFPLKDPEGGREIPNYQAYVVLAWLRLAGLVKQHGRRGYSVKTPSQLIEAVRAEWQKLPERPV